MNRLIESGVITNKWYQSKAVCHNSWLSFCLPVHRQTAPSVCQWSRMQCMCYSMCLSLFSECMQYLTLILILLCAATSSLCCDLFFPRFLSEPLLLNVTLKTASCTILCVLQTLMLLSPLEAALKTILHRELCRE